MADEPQKVIVQASRIDSTALPPNFSQTYRLYVLQGASDLKQVADASNNANDLAYQAKVKNDEQDIVLSDHETRIKTSEDKISVIEGRVSNVEGRVSATENDISALTGRVTSAEMSIAGLQNGKASKTEVLLKADNLSGLANASTARGNLGLGDSATKNVGTTEGTVAAGDDTRLSTVNNKTGGAISSSISVTGRIDASQGFGCRAGQGAANTTHVFNIFWNGSAAELWIDGLKIGTINTTA